MAPRDYQEFAAAVRERLPKLAGGQLRIAHLVLADPEGSAHRGIDEAARMLDVRESSITRFANSLGLRGYPEIMELCRSWLTEQARLSRRADDGSRPPGGALSAALDQERVNLTRTYGRLDAEAFSRATGLLTEAPRVHVLGSGESASVAALFTSRLSRVRPGVRAVGVPIMDGVREFAAGDVLVAVSVRRYAAETVRVAEYASDRGLPVVALTDHTASPLAALADAALYAEIDGIGEHPSFTACLSLAQTLSAGVAVRRGDPGPEDSTPDFGFYHRS
ncbi:MurR/RpiR family transcriptional regulator [Amycolatopsis pigmentata]|uniref:MurR/RpiR family transcriptional regulator n=1 Tax=Amycolatopsis pigmentata TaxID=450801 RepID=A0ABW5FQK4_9PSEU